MNNIYINNKKVSSHWLVDPENKEAQNELRKFHKHRIRPKCLCLQNSKNRELLVKKRNYFFLAIRSGTGQNHAEWCEFYRDDSSSSGNTYEQEAVIENGQHMDVNLDTYIEVLTDDLKKDSTNKKNTSGKSRDSITLLAFFKRCLQKTKINTWFPNRKYQRTFNTVQSNIYELANNIKIGKFHLSDIIMIPRWDIDRDNSVEQNSKLLRKQTCPDRAAIVIGEVNRWIPSRKEVGGIGVGLNLLNNLIWMCPEKAAAVENSFRQLISEIKLKDRRILAICTVFRTGEYYTIGDIALLRTNLQFIPVDSSYELGVANKLIEEKRGFTKPLRLEEERYLPDFVLNDCNETWVLEVFGVVGNPEYDERKKQKLIYYSQKKINLWQWTPTEEDCIPPFPT